MSTMWLDWFLVDTYSIVEKILRCLTGQSFQDFGISLLVDFRGICVSSLSRRRGPGLINRQHQTDEWPVKRISDKWMAIAEEKGGRTPRRLYGKRQERLLGLANLISGENPRDFLVPDIFTSQIRPWSLNHKFPKSYGRRKPIHGKSYDCTYWTVNVVFWPHILKKTWKQF